MRILISSHLFAPSIGGIEQVAGVLAEEFSALGHEVRVITQTACDEEPEAAYRVIRRPGARQLVSLTRWCDVYLQNNLSLATLWPAWLTRRPMVVAHHTWISQPDGRILWRDKLKRLSLRTASANLSVSQVIADALPVASVIAPNPYRENVFFEEPETPRDRDLVFLGRLVSDKGVGVLIEALARMKSRGLAPALTIIGEGPEKDPLHQQAAKAGVAGQLTFAGVLSGAALREALNRHRILVVPSLWAEPFGLVALEGAACGCVVVGSDKGGLPDAIGPCGALFPNGDADALANQLERLLKSAGNVASPAVRAGHLARHHRRDVAEFYLNVFRDVLKR